MEMIHRGSVHWINLEPAQGAEIKKTRPCVVVSIDPINRARHTAVVIPLSSSAQPRPPLTIPVMCDNRPSVAVIDQIRTVDKSRFSGKMCDVSEREMQAIDSALLIVLGLGKF